MLELLYWAEKKEGNASEKAEWTKGGKNNRKISVREKSLFM